VQREQGKQGVKIDTHLQQVCWFVTQMSGFPGKFVQLF
jgi:hypothetical protein